jgi:homopolymeric O-antigen transport system ATP-binding protein
MSDTVIHVENLWKEYRLGAISHRTLTRDLQSWWARVRGKEDPNVQIGSTSISHLRSEDRFWALSDISFDVKQGEVLGIIGRNGAGKSTLLKILSQVTAPTKGEVRYKGRIASLLEVGTGFHPELTGRENIFLNGAILGMSKAEIRKKLDEIIAFAEVEKFIDTPVKRYSSGMYVRLAFAVAAHLEPEILLVDEVLAVGDVQFQNKCMGKMRNVAQQGRTILFVSHNLVAIKTLCSRGILLENGILQSDGLIEEVISHYFMINTPKLSSNLGSRIDRLGDGRLRFTDIRFLNENHDPIKDIISGEKLIVEAEYYSDGTIIENKVIISFGFYDLNKNLIMLFASDEMGCQFQPFGQEGKLSVEIPRFALRGGKYTLKLFASHLTTAPENFIDVIEDASTLQVLPGDYWETGKTNREGAYSIIDAILTN